MRQEVRITQTGRPSDYVKSIREKIRERNDPQSMEFRLSGLEGAMLVVCDTAQLLVQSNVAEIQTIQTKRIMVQSRYDHSTVPKNLLQIVMTEPSVKISSE